MRLRFKIAFGICVYASEMSYITALVFWAAYMCLGIFVSLRLLDNLPLTEHPKWCIVSDASPASRTSHAPKVADICTYICGMHVTSHRIRRPSLDIVECARAVTRYGCNVVSLEVRLSRGAGEELVSFRRVKMIFPRRTLAHCITSGLFLCARQMLVRAGSSHWHIYPVGSK